MRKYGNLDGLRSLAAIGVLCMHVYANIGFKVPESGFGGFLINEIVSQFGIFVQLFFIISGFGMCCGYYDKIKNQKIDLHSFYSKRYLKILPFFTLLVVLDLVAALLFDGGITVVKLYEAFSNLTLMFGFYASQGMSVIGVGWTLGVIFGFYILFPFFVYLIWNKKKAWITLVVTLTILYINGTYFHAGESMVFPWLCYFVAGGLLYLYRDTLEKWMRNQYIAILTVITGFALVFLLKLPGEGSLGIIVVTLQKLIGFSMMVTGALSVDMPLLCNPITKFISNLSLEIYLSHMLIFRVIEKLNLACVFGGGATVSYIVTCLLTIAGTLVFASGYQRIEKEIRNRISAC